MVKFINYNGKKYPIRIGYRAIKKFQEETEKSIAAIGDDISLYEILLFHALETGAKIEKRELDLKRDDMEFVLDACFFDFIKMVESFFPTETEEQVAEKKQSPGKKSPGKK